MPRFHHAAHHQLGQTKGCLEIGVDHRIPLVIFHAHGKIIASNAGVVDQDADRSVFFLDLTDQDFACCGVGYVEYRTPARKSGLSKAMLNIRGALYSRRGADDRSALPSQFQCNGATVPREAPVTRAIFSESM